MGISLQLTPAEELRCYYKAATIIAEMLADSHVDCPDPEKFDPSGKCAHPSPELCGKCFRNYAINRAIKEMEGQQMSNTTITPEERAQWLAEAQPKNIDYYEPIDFELDKRIRRLIGAIEQSEKELAGADAEIAELRDELEDSRGTEKDAPNILCAIARLVGVYEYSQELGDDVGEVTLDAVRDLLAEKQAAEANVARLTKMVDLMANQLYCPSEFTNCAVDCAECRKEAARRAVAAGEG